MYVASTALCLEAGNASQIGNFGAGAIDMMAADMEHTKTPDNVAYQLIALHVNHSGH